LSGATNSASAQLVAIQVPSAYVSQQSDGLELTLVRTSAGGHSRDLGPLTVDFTASYGSLPHGSDSTTAARGQQFTPVDQSVTFPAGVRTETVAVPINAGAPNPGLVPIELTVSSTSRAVRGSDETIYLASGPEAVPPSIVAVERVKGGIALTFSKSMDPKTVTNIHNYSVEFSPSQQFTLTQLTGVGLIQTLNNTKQTIGLRRASYDPSTNSVILVPNERLGPNGSYTVSNPSSLLAKRGGPHQAHALTDLQGNAIYEGGSRTGVFSITISKGHPYTATSAVLASGH
jgi:hypothetical protein